MLKLQSGDRMRSRWDEALHTVIRREHDFEYERYLIAWDDDEESDIWSDEYPDLEKRVRCGHTELRTADI
jgi:hypothetical protein